MPAPSEMGNTVDLTSSAKPEWLGKSVWQMSDLEISSIKSWPSIAAIRYNATDGEGFWRGGRNRLLLWIPEDNYPLYPVQVQVDQGRPKEVPVVPGALSFQPAGVDVRSVHPSGKRVQVLWDTELYSALLPELGTAASGFEFVYPLQDPLLAQIVTSLAQEVEGRFADSILVQSLSTALCIGVAQHFVGRLRLPTSKGLSPERLQRVRDYVEAHLDEDLSLTVLADIACLSPYHFSRSFKQAVGVGPQRYVIQRRIERAKTLLRQTREPLALIALEAGFSNQSILTTIFHREMGVTPGRFRAELV
jgi:AraC family transcriptional regulator